MRDRFIPTYVGHTVGYPVRCGNVAVHPHIRGAYHLDFVGDGKHGGSSPHTWGIRQFAAFAPVKVRFIPTYVGHTPSISAFIIRGPVHPHIRGAYVVWNISNHQLRGSSPHTWGIRLRVSPLPWSARFIPTYVGHTQFGTEERQTQSVHPHIRGAYSTTISCPLPKYGSSPHTWGIQSPNKDQRDLCRFIPTYVGHTVRLPRR